MRLAILNRFLRPLGLSLVKNNYYPAHVDMFCDAEAGFRAAYESVEGFSLTSYERMFSLYKAVEYIAKAKITGDLVECGVWRGGSSMMMALALLQVGDDKRHLYLYDTFEGMPASSQADKDYGGRDAGEIFTDAKRQETFDNLTVGIEEVQKNIQQTGYPAERIHLIKGKVEQTIPEVVPEQIALARLDTDFFESTYHEFLQLWPRVSKGGVVIIDDYGHWQGARKATDQFLAEQGIAVLLQRIDYTARLIIKP